MSYPARVLAFRDDGEIEGLSGDQFAMLTDLLMTRGASAPGLLDAVYLSSAGVVDKTLATPATTPCIGIVSALLPGNLCLVRHVGSLAGFVGLAPGSVYYVDDVIPGGTSTTAPSASGTVVQEAFTAIAADTALMQIGDWVEN